MLTGFCSALCEDDLTLLQLCWGIWHTTVGFFFFYIFLYLFLLTEGKLLCTWIYAKHYTFNQSTTDKVCWERWDWERDWNPPGITLGLLCCGSNWPVLKSKNVKNKQTKKVKAFFNMKLAWLIYIAQILFMSIWTGSQSWETRLELSNAGFFSLQLGDILHHKTHTHLTDLI